jgi:hypothetical protein
LINFLTKVEEESEGVLFEVEWACLLEGEHKVEVLRPAEHGYRLGLAHQLVAAGAVGGGVAQRLQRRRRHRQGVGGCGQKYDQRSAHLIISTRY